MSPILAHKRAASVFLLVLATIVLIIIAFGTTVFLGFVRDDYTNLYYIQQGLLLPYPYHADTLRLWPLYQLFHLSPGFYYATGVILFGVATAVFYWFTLLLYKKRLVAATTALFFIFSLVGSYAMYVMTEAIRHTTYLILQLMTMSLFLLFLKSGKRLIYLISILFFSATLLIFPYRAFTFIFVIFSLFVLFQTRKRLLIAGLYQLLPFLVIVFVTYIVFPNLPTVKTIRPLSATMFTNVLSWNAISNYLLTFLFLFIPSTSIPHLVSSTSWLMIVRAFSWVFALSIFLLIRSFKKTHINRVLRFSLFSLLVTLAGFVLYAPEYYITGDRYLMTVRPFLALFLGAIVVQSLSSLQFTGRKHRFLSAIVAAVALFVFMLQGVEHFRTQYHAIERHGPPAKNTIAAIRSAIPNMPKYSIVFIDAQTNELRDTYVDPFRVGTLPAGASLAVYYGTRYETIEITDYMHCDVFEATLKRWSDKQVSIFYFLATEQGVVAGKSTQAFERCNIIGVRQ